MILNKPPLEESHVIHAYAAAEAGGTLEPYAYEPGPLGPEQVELQVRYCGICHSDLSMLDNEWGLTKYPFVPGHEVIGTVRAVGSQVRTHKVGDTVGLGWYSQSCRACEACVAGYANLCATAEQTIVGRHGGFADIVRCHAAWAIPLPGGVAPQSAGPLFCGGITVFAPLVECDVRPTQRVGVVGIGGLGHMALQFLAKWGCEVTAFTSSDSKAEAAKRFGAHHVVDSRSTKALKDAAGTLDFILVTANVALDWSAYLGTLRPKGRLHFVGAVLEPLQIPPFMLISKQTTISGSPLGNPAVTQQMLEFCARHQVAPQIETFALSDVNRAIQHLRAGKARYRIVLDAQAQ